MSYFWHSNWYYFGYISGKVAKPHFLDKTTGVSQNKSKFISIGPLITKQRPLKIWKICVFWRLLFQKTNCWHLKFFMNQIFEQRFIIFEKLRYMGQLLLKLRAVKVATSVHWICQDQLDQLNNKHAKIAVNSAIRYFEGYSQKKCLLKVWSFLVHLLVVWYSY